MSQTARKDEKQILHNQRRSVRVSASAPHLDACVECILGNVLSSLHVRHLKQWQRQSTCGPLRQIYGLLTSSPISGCFPPAFVLTQLNAGYDSPDVVLVPGRPCLRPSDEQAVMSAKRSGRRGQVWADFSADGGKSSVCHSGRAEKEEKSLFEALIDLCVSQY